MSIMSDPLFWLLLAVLVGPFALAVDGLYHFAILAVVAVVYIVGQVVTAKTRTTVSSDTSAMDIRLTGIEAREDDVLRQVAELRERVNSLNARVMR